MRQALLNGIFAGALASLMSSIGYPIDTWPFWIAILLMLASNLNSSIR